VPPETFDLDGILGNESGIFWVSKDFADHLSLSHPKMAVKDRWDAVVKEFMDKGTYELSLATATDVPEPK